MDKLYCPDLVHAFYENFQSKDISPDGNTIYVLWGEQRRPVDLNMISRITHVPVSVGLPPHGVYDDY